MRSTAIKTTSQCGRIEVDKLKGSLIDCLNRAVWLSPERLHTTGKLKVCDKCKESMKHEYTVAGRVVVFTRLVNGGRK